MATVPAITLSNGIKMPAFGLGTYRVNFHLFQSQIFDNTIFPYFGENNCCMTSNKNVSNHLNSIHSNQLKGGEGIAVIKRAIDLGYRHLDTAFLYNNEQEVGEAIRDKIAENVISRSDIFVATKVCCYHCDLILSESPILSAIRWFVCISYFISARRMVFSAYQHENWENEIIESNIATVVRYMLSANSVSRE